MSKPSGGPNFQSQAAKRPDGYDWYMDLSIL
jgi:hypothetical protein